jgi:hypothetical protein
MDKKFKLKLSGPGLDLDTALTEAQAKMIFNIAFAPAAGDAGTGAGTIIPDATTATQTLPVGAAPAPRDFIVHKNPMNEQERLTCLAYYLYKYRKLEKFTSKELKDLNGVAAQPRFNNVSYTARDAVNTGYLAAVGGGKKTLSAVGERVVDAMPNREKVAEALKKFGKKNRKKAPAKKTK